MTSISIDKSFFSEIHHISNDKEPYTPFTTKKDGITIVCLEILKREVGGTFFWTPYTYSNKNKDNELAKCYSKHYLYYRYTKKAKTSEKPKPNVRVVQDKYPFYIISEKNVKFGIKAQQRSDVNIFKIKCYNIEENKITKFFEEILFLSDCNKTYIDNSLTVLARDILHKKVRNFDINADKLKKELLNEKYSLNKEEKSQSNILNALKNIDSAKSVPSTNEKHQVEVIEDVEEVEEERPTKRFKINTLVSSDKGNLEELTLKNAQQNIDSAKSVPCTNEKHQAKVIVIEDEEEEIPAEGLKTNTLVSSDKGNLEELTLKNAQLKQKLANLKTRVLVVAHSETMVLNAMSLFDEKNKKLKQYQQDNVKHTQDISEAEQLNSQLKGLHRLLEEKIKESDAMLNTCSQITASNEQLKKEYIELNGLISTHQQNFNNNEK